MASFTCLITTRLPSSCCGTAPIFILLSTCGLGAVAGVFSITLSYQDALGNTQVNVTHTSILSEIPVNTEKPILHSPSTGDVLTLDASCTVTFTLLEDYVVGYLVLEVTQMGGVEDTNSPHVIELGSTLTTTGDHSVILPALSQLQTPGSNGYERTCTCAPLHV